MEKCLIRTLAQIPGVPLGSTALIANSVSFTLSPIQRWWEELKERWVWNSFLATVLLHLHCLLFWVFRVGFCTALWDISWCKKGYINTFDLNWINNGKQWKDPDLLHVKKWTLYTYCKGYKLYSTSREYIGEHWHHCECRVQLNAFLVPVISQPKPCK